MLHRQWDRTEFHSKRCCRYFRRKEGDMDCMTYLSKAAL